MVILKCLKGEPIPVYGNGENIRDWLYVEDHCKALESVLLNGRIGETYNIGGNAELKNIDLVKMLCSLMDYHSANTIPKGKASHSNLISFVEDRPGHDKRYAIDSSKIRNELDWKPAETPTTGFSRTVDWYLNNQQWWKDILTGDYQLERQGLRTN